MRRARRPGSPEAGAISLSEPGTRPAAPELSAVVLGYRAGDGLLRVLEPLHALLEESGLTFELVVVANYWPGAGDRTPEVAQAFGRLHPDTVVVLDRPKAGGMGWDMRSGLAAARGRTLIVMDGDAQNPVEDVLGMYRLMASEHLDVAKGRRVSRSDGLYRSVVSFVYNVAFRVLFRTSGLWDINGKPKGLTREAYEQIAPHLRSDDWFTDAELILCARRLGLRVGELPVRFLASVRPSHVRPSAIVEFFGNMIAYRLRGRPRR